MVGVGRDYAMECRRKREVFAKAQCRCGRDRSLVARPNFAGLLCGYTFIRLGVNMEDTVRWTVLVSRETDTALRSYLARQGTKKGDLSKFVEEAVRWRVLDRVVSEAKARNSGVPAKKMQAAIDEVLAEVRAEGFAPVAR